MISYDNFGKRFSVGHRSLCIRINMRGDMGKDELKQFGSRSIWRRVANGRIGRGGGRDDDT